jgi:hypothetical protein
MLAGDAPGLVAREYWPHPVQAGARDQEMRMQISARIYQQRYDNALQPWDRTRCGVQLLDVFGDAPRLGHVILGRLWR